MGPHVTPKCAADPRRIEAKQHRLHEQLAGPDPGLIVSPSTIPRWLPSTSSLERLPPAPNRLRELHTSRQTAADLESEQPPSTRLYSTCCCYNDLAHLGPLRCEQRPAGGLCILPHRLEPITGVCRVPRRRQYGVFGHTAAATGPHIGDSKEARPAVVAPGCADGCFSVKSIGADDADCWQG